MNLKCNFDLPHPHWWGRRLGLTVPAVTVGPDGRALVDGRIAALATEVIGAYLLDRLSRTDTPFVAVPQGAATTDEYSVVTLQALCHTAEDIGGFLVDRIPVPLLERSESLDDEQYAPVQALPAGRHDVGYDHGGEG